MGRHTAVGGRKRPAVAQGYGSLQRFKRSGDDPARVFHACQVALIVNRHAAFYSIEKRSRSEVDNMPEIESASPEIIQKIADLQKLQGNAVCIPYNLLVDLGISENTAKTCSILQYLNLNPLVVDLERHPSGINYNGSVSIGPWEEQGRYYGDWPLPYPYFDGYELVDWHGNSESAVLVGDDKATYFHRGYLTAQNAELVAEIIEAWPKMSDVAKFIRKRFSIPQPSLLILPKRKFYE